MRLWPDAELDVLAYVRRGGPLFVRVCSVWLLLDLRMSFAVIRNSDDRAFWLFSLDLMLGEHHVVLRDNVICLLGNRLYHAWRLHLNPVGVLVRKLLLDLLLLFGGLPRLL